MHVLIDSKDPESLAVRPLAERRVRFVLRRLTWFIPRARLRLAAESTAREGAEKLCHLELKTRRGGIVVIVARARDWRSAVEAALARAVRAMLRTWQLGLTYPRPALQPVRIASRQTSRSN